MPRSPKHAAPPAKLKKRGRCVSSYKNQIGCNGFIMWGLEKAGGLKGSIYRRKDTRQAKLEPKISLSLFLSLSLSLSLSSRQQPGPDCEGQRDRETESGEKEGGGRPLARTGTSSKEKKNKTTHACYKSEIGAKNRLLLLSCCQQAGPTCEKGFDSTVWGPV